MKEEVDKIVFKIIKNNTEDLNIGSINHDTLLLSEGSAVDSMTIVTIVVDLESELSEVFQKEISLSDDKAMSRKISPFVNVRNLIEYINELLD